MSSIPGTPEQYAVIDSATRESCVVAYDAYQRMLDAGIAREVARMVLPVTIYSSAYVTMNARALMNFLSLRKKSDDATYPELPPAGNRNGRGGVRGALARLMPITHEAFVASGRVAP